MKEKEKKQYLATHIHGDEGDIHAGGKRKWSSYKIQNTHIKSL